MDCNEDPSRANMWRDVRIDISNMASGSSMPTRKTYRMGVTTNDPRPVIHTLDALDSMVERGITLDNGLLELVDNPVDWGASRIHVHIWKWADGSISVSVADDGAGISELVRVDPDTGVGEPCQPDQSDDSTIQGLQQALRIGGRIEGRGVTRSVGSDSDSPDCDSAG